MVAQDDCLHTIKRKFIIMFSWFNFILRVEWSKTLISCLGFPQILSQNFDHFQFSFALLKLVSCNGVGRGSRYWLQIWLTVC